MQKMAKKVGKMAIFFGKNGQRIVKIMLRNWLKMAIFGRFLPIFVNFVLRISFCGQKPIFFVSFSEKIIFILERIHEKSGQMGRTRFQQNLSPQVGLVFLLQKYEYAFA